MATEGGSAPRVVVGVDGSDVSIVALKWAANYAAATGASVTAVLSWHYPAAYGLPVGVAPKPVQTKLDYGHPAEVLVAESRQADLLVVGHRGHGAFTGMLLGSVSMHCVTSAECPVVVVRGHS